MAALMSSLASLSLSSTIPAIPASRSTASNNNGAQLLRIECSSHAQKKATAHHNKSRPKKHNPYDKNRHGPTIYKRLPKPPPIWGFDTSELDVKAEEASSSELDVKAEEASSSEAPATA